MANPETNRKLHKALAILGLCTLFLSICFSVYEESNYQRNGLDIEVISSPLLYAICSIVAAYFILNYIWHRSANKKPLFISFVVIALANTICLVLVIITIIKNSIPEKPGQKVMHIFDGLFRSNNPPPKWLSSLNDALPVFVMLLITASFIILLRFRKQWIQHVANPGNTLA